MIQEEESPQNNDEQIQLTEYSERSELAIHETKLSESFDQLVNVFELLSKNFDLPPPELEDQDNQTGQFSVKNLNKEVNSSYQRTKKAGDQLNNLYLKIKSV